LPPQSCVIPRSISESGVHHGMVSPACSYSVMKIFRPCESPTTSTC
jgi:hypothetical protein